MVLTDKQKEKMRDLLDDDDTAKLLDEDLNEILFLDIDDYHNMQFYVQDIEERDNIAYSKNPLDAYEEESDERTWAISDLIKHRRVDIFCDVIKHINNSHMELDLKYFAEDAKEKLGRLKTDLAKEIIVDNN